MDEILLITEIHARFDSEWVLLEDPEVSKQMEILGGKVLWHSKDRDEVYQKAVELRPKHSAFLYTGATPADAVIVIFGAPHVAFDLGPHPGSHPAQETAGGMLNACAAPSFA